MTLTHVLTLEYAVQPMTVLLLVYVYTDMKDLDANLVKIKLKKITKLRINILRRPM